MSMYTICRINSDPGCKIPKVFYILSHLGYPSAPGFCQCIICIAIKTCPPAVTIIAIVSNLLVTSFALRNLVVALMLQVIYWGKRIAYSLLWPLNSLNFSQSQFAPAGNNGYSGCLNCCHKIGTISAPIGHFQEDLACNRGCAVYSVWGKGGSLVGS